MVCSPRSVLRLSYRPSVSTVHGGIGPVSSDCSRTGVICPRPVRVTGKHAGVDTSGDPGRGARDVALLRQAVQLLNDRNYADLELPGPSAEFLLFAMARLLEAIAGSLERGDELASDVQENAERIARHVEHYIDTYLPLQK
jgi:hypothetical protein